MVYTKAIKKNGKKYYYRYRSYRDKDGNVKTEYLGKKDKNTNNKENGGRHGTNSLNWIFFMRLLFKFCLFFLLITLAVIVAIKAADFKMNVVYPPSKFCGCGLDLSMEDRIQCSSDCLNMRDKERSLTIGFLSILAFSAFYVLVDLIFMNLVGKKLKLVEFWS